MHFPSHCPHCNYCLDEGDIYESFLEKLKTPEKALEAAHNYGWSKDNRLRFSQIIGIYDFARDEVSHYICPDCKKKIDNL